MTNDECKMIKEARNPRAEDLCLKCGLCCNGVIFADVRLQPRDNPERLKELGLALGKPEGRGPKAEDRNQKFAQPCVALEGCRCRIYDERPKYCRQFECLLLKSVKAGRTQPAAALRKISAARDRAEKVRVLLRALGNADEHVAISVRFRRVARRMGKGELGPGMAGEYGELTLAVQDLNLLLSEAFYPGT